MSIVNQSDSDRLFELDPLFSRIYDQYGSPPNWTRPPGFISLSKIILEQQVSLASANAHFLKLNSFLKEFTPSEILKLTDEEMRTCQISRQKATYLRELSDAILYGNLSFDSFGNMADAEIRKELTRIKGIGDWTTDIYLLFCLQAKDIFPAGDIAVINTIRALTPAQTKEEILTLSENWKPLRSLATYYLWHYYLRKRNRV
ncbi:MAG: DNA-3-methyladenine glycosylase 2 family protein [Bacteroidetes bacterium]|nr:DNA-3-methyladenine glycosylase 2 family protein [Bacteroidota bacterium]